MSSLWGWASIVLEGETAKRVFAILERAKEECAKEENGYCSEKIAAGDNEYCFAHGLRYEYKNSSEDNEFSPLVLVGKHPIMDYFALYLCPIDEEERTFTEYGHIKYKFAGSILTIDESTYASSGLMLKFLFALFGEDCPELYYWVNNEADYIGKTNDINHKYFTPEEY